jgi:hypothetical protein
MKKNAVLVAVALGLFGAAGLPASRPSAPAGGAPQDDRAGFYVKQVVDHIGVVDPAAALGEPDGRFAEIRPGGEMTVLMAAPIYYSDASDDGTVVAKGDGRYGLAGLFRMNEEGQSAWQPLPTGRTPGGFKVGTIMFNVVQSTDTVKIANDDARSVFVDAVIGYGKGERAR